MQRQRYEKYIVKYKGNYETETFMVRGADEREALQKFFYIMAGRDVEILEIKKIEARHR